MMQRITVDCQIRLLGQMYLTAPANIDDLVVQILKQKESCRLSDFH